MSEHGVLPYLDIPFQHGSPAVLKRMRRPAHAEDTLRRIEAWRAQRPDLTLRSTFIVGFPGETEAGVRAAAGVARCGAARSRRLLSNTRAVEGAAANALAAAVPEPVKEERYQRFMQKAGAISARAPGGARRAALPRAGRCRRARGRGGAHAGDAPEIDGMVRIRTDPGSRGSIALRSGEFAQVKIIGADTYDLEARLGAAHQAS